MRSSRLPDEKRAEIAEDIRRTAGTPDGSYRKIAARHSVGVATVQTVAKENGLADAWKDGHEQTRAATEVKTANAAARRAQLQVDLLGDAQELRERMFGNVRHLHVVKVAGEFAGESVEHTVVPTGPREWRDIMSAIGVASSKSVELARLEAEQAGAGQASGLLEQFERSLRSARVAREQAIDEAP
ncbi:hypothetical protein [Kibdelosporangium phytohabitans]|uniref:Uncharacterized protein n=1 Tax=Kibdelosporangium phytohabitans TaxID=860235 RepID=A0A0N9HZS2_9PSEU|nr:hypothetical protein [Kibdelosporangium phytohabitans]ALG07651.1 hypothetical protein AOZ06_12700 [Kibdelosporangium phytohabitans]ALG07707.1 hypothetical protein AOZ06_13020 [Kibdelosporangium phytohabitans]MBE1471392.1 hypothetical protein [Kibdelosporangium phytohabitans]